MWVAKRGCFPVVLTSSAARSCRPSNLWAIATRSVGDALDAAMRAVELSQDDVARRAQVVARLRTAEADAPPGQDAAWSQLRRNFEAL